MSLHEADELRRIADMIDEFPKFIRRDNGGISVVATIQGILARHDIRNDELVMEIEQLTADFRRTVVNYYTRQFGA